MVWPKRFGCTRGYRAFRDGMRRYYRDHYTLPPAAKNLGTTHITNGCYRLRPVGWNIDEAAGTLAAYCVDRGVPPRAVLARPEHLRDIQALLGRQGVELAWPRIGPV